MRPNLVSLMPDLKMMNENWKTHNAEKTKAVKSTVPSFCTYVCVVKLKTFWLNSVLRIWIRMFLGLPDSHPKPLVTSADPAPDPALDPAPDPSIIKQNMQEKL